MCRSSCARRRRLCGRVLLQLKLFTLDYGFYCWKSCCTSTHQSGHYWQCHCHNHYCGFHWIVTGISLIPLIYIYIGSRFSGFRECGEEKELGGPFASTPDWFPVPFGLQAASFETCGLLAKLNGIAEPASSSFRFCSFCLNWFIVHQAPHLQPPKEQKSSSIVIRCISGWDGRTDKSCQKLQQKEKKNSLETVATFSSPIFRPGRTTVRTGWDGTIVLYRFFGPFFESKQPFF